MLTVVALTLSSWAAPPNSELLAEGVRELLQAPESDPSDWAGGLEWSQEYQAVSRLVDELYQRFPGPRDRLLRPGATAGVSASDRGTCQGR